MPLKSYKPTSPGQRDLVLVDKSDLWNGPPEKSLSFGLSKKGGRNNSGRITMRRKGGGAKRLYRVIDFKRNKTDIKGTINQIHSLEEAGADIIVVGSHGRHGLALLLGSTANGVLHGASCDVLAVRVGHDDSEST